MRTGCIAYIAFLVLGGCADDAGSGGSGSTSTGGENTSSGIDTTGSTALTGATESTSTGDDGTSSSTASSETSVDSSGSTGSTSDSTTGDPSSSGTETGRFVPQCEPTDDGGGGELPELEGCEATDPEGALSNLDFVPSKVLAATDGTILLFDQSGSRIVRWSTSLGVLAPDITLSAGAYDVAYSPSLDTIFVGRSNGEIARIELALGLDEELFAVLMGTPLGLQVVGEYLLAVDDVGAWESHHVFDADGMLLTSVEWNHPSPEYTWSEANERLYFFRAGTSPNDLHWEQVDQATGLIVADGESPYHGAYDIEPPIRVSSDGSHVLLGSGHIYDGLTIERPAAIPVRPVDAWWTESGFVTLREGEGASTVVERWEPDAWSRADARLLAGTPVAITEASTGLVILTRDAGQLRFHDYAAGEDGDGDGVAYADDDFPLDPGASVDQDHDGSPDAWNGDCTDVDSTTGLILDAHPDFAACATAGPCSIDDQPVSAPPTGAVVDASGTIYLLADQDRRILRWSSAEDSWLDPIPIEPDAVYIALHRDSGTLFVAHSTGWIGRIEVCGELFERHFVTLPEGPHGLALAGDYVLSADPTMAWNTHSTFDLAGQEISRVEWNERSSSYAWNSSLERIYFFRDGTSPNDLHYEVVDQTSGQITDAGESPYHGDFQMQPPIAVSHDGSLVLIGTGQLYDASTLVDVGSIPVEDLVDAVWRPTRLLTLTASAGQALAESWTLDYSLDESAMIEGTPFRVFATPHGRRVATIVDGQPVVSAW